MTGIPTLYWKLRRIASGWRQQDVAVRAGLSVSQYSAIERGDKQASASEMARIEAALPEIPTELIRVSGIEMPKG